MANVFVAGHALIERDGKYLVTRRSAINDYMPLQWDLPGGTIDDEMFEDGVRREVREETGLQVEVGRPVFVFTNRSHDRRVFQIVCACRYVSGEVTLNAEEHDQFEWVPRERLGDREAIAFLHAFVDGWRRVD